MLDPRTRRWRMRLLPLRRWGKPVAEVHINHVKLLVDVRDEGCGVILYLNEEYEQAETKWFKRTLRPGMTVVDIGAHIGYFTTLAASLVAPSGRVIAVEPDPHNFKLLTRNIRRNGLHNVTVLPIALGNRRGQATLYRSPTNGGDHRLIPDRELSRPIDVTIDTLDHVLQQLRVESVDAIKIDVQGYEPYVLSGSSQAITKSPTLMILSELWPYGLKRAGWEARDFFETTGQWGFSARILQDNGQARPVDWRQLQHRVPELDASNPNIFTNVVFHRLPK